MEKPSYQDYLDGTAKVLKASQNENEKYEVEVLGRKFVVYPGTFSPKYFEDTRFFAQEVFNQLKPGENFLEIGPGTGVILVFAALAGAQCLGIEINKVACDNALVNIKNHGLEKKIKVRHGSLYEPLALNEKFDVIFWNTPFGLIGKKDLTVLEKAVFDPGYKMTQQFIMQAKRHLKPNGRLLIGFSTTLGRYDLLQKFLHKAGFTTRLIAKTESQEIYPVYFELFAATLSN